MTIYNFNLGIGWASSGVEYAQSYRAKIFKKINEKAKFIFTDMIDNENIAYLTNNIGIENEDVIWLYQYFTDIKIATGSYTLEKFFQHFKMENPTKIEEQGKVIKYFYDDRNIFITIYLKEEHSDIITMVEYVTGGLLVRKDYYSYTRVLTEYYAPENNAAHLYQRRFYNEDGSIAYDEIIDGNTESIYRFKDKVIYTKENFIEYFVEQLNLTNKDIVILDRTTGIGQAVLQNCGNAKVGVVVHAEHFSENATDDNYILWNNFYDYQFTNAHNIDFFIVATDSQNAILSEQFNKYGNINPRIITIPVGSIDDLKRSDNRKKFFVVTASRLAAEKHVDWLVKAVILAKKSIPQLTFDIYGVGGEESKILKIIEEHNANDYINLKGHKNLESVYKNYEIYISASTSEGFGLTLLEAIGSGLPIIGFDVRYGNQTFIEDKKNGYLIPMEEIVINDIVEQFSQKIVDIFSSSLDDFHSHSYDVAERFLTKRVEEKWKNTIREVIND